MLLNAVPCNDAILCLRLRPARAHNAGQAPPSPDATSPKVFSNRILEATTGPRGLGREPPGPVPPSRRATDGSSADEEDGASRPDPPPPRPAHDPDGMAACDARDAEENPHRNDNDTNAVGDEEDSSYGYNTAVMAARNAIDLSNSNRSNRTSRRRRGGGSEAVGGFGRNAGVGRRSRGLWYVAGRGRFFG